MQGPVNDVGCVGIRRVSQPRGLSFHARLRGTSPYAISDETDPGTYPHRYLPDGTIKIVTPPTLRAVYASLQFAVPYCPVQRRLVSFQQNHVALEEGGQ